MNQLRILSLTIGLALFGAAFAVHAYDEAAVGDGGSVSGAVLFEGTAPERQHIEVKAPCENHDALSEDLIVVKSKDKQFLVNAIVTINEIEKGKAFSKDTPGLDQKGCVFTPHILVVPAGADFKMANSDDCNHNIHTHSDLNPESNKAVSPKSEAKAHFSEPERIAVRCDMHTWMKGWIVVVDNPYYSVTGQDGAFKIDKIPPGKYKLSVWHETLGEQSKEFTVKAGEDSKLEFSFKSK